MNRALKENYFFVTNYNTNGHRLLRRIPFIVPLSIELTITKLRTQNLKHRT